ncbi:GreA/GreB family elongation factor [Geomonas sp. Red32]|uniref:GreA/GreB family elongation factor n=1 Tax=Geomonas sp. Red32 TaxID=2912856 RepID=UPI00202D0C52|nr:GreA/GreB family elongation factor [Geomonas sp. Red32]MCM0083921.1 GreA/GreB family elongation factor [Geomonas sp. Red32]
MDKNSIVEQIVTRLNADLELFFSAAKTAHAAATHAENQPDNKYDTLALESSYLAQGQANRAQEIRLAISVYKQLVLPEPGEPAGIGSLVTIEAADGSAKTLFIGPLAGGMKIEYQGTELMVITPTSPIGRELMGKDPGDSVEIRTGPRRIEYEIVEVQ